MKKIVILILILPTLVQPMVLDHFIYETHGEKKVIYLEQKENNEILKEHLTKKGDCKITEYFIELIECELRNQPEKWKLFLQDVLPEIQATVNIQVKCCRAAIKQQFEWNHPAAINSLYKELRNLRNNQLRISNIDPLFLMLQNYSTCRKNIIENSSLTCCILELQKNLCERLGSQIIKKNLEELKNILPNNSRDLALFCKIYEPDILAEAEISHEFCLRGEKRKIKCTGKSQMNTMLINTEANKLRIIDFFKKLENTFSNPC